MMFRAIRRLNKKLLINIGGIRVEGFQKELVYLLAYHLYVFRMENHLTEAEMVKLLRGVTTHPSFEKEYGEEF